MKISIGSDHRGYELKTFLKQNLPDIVWSDEGSFSAERVDYPVFAKKVCDSVLSGDVERGILICGSGIGMSIASNRKSGIYAALCWNEQIATSAREDDKANILVLPADFVTQDQALSICNAWLSASFKGERYQDRLDMIDG